MKILTRDYPYTPNASVANESPHWRPAPVDSFHESAGLTGWIAAAGTMRAIIAKMIEGGANHKSFAVRTWANTPFDNRLTTGGVFIRDRLIKYPNMRDRNMPRRRSQ